jgi:alkylresorcinol/alkylpyrone synthase
MQPVRLVSVGVAHPEHRVEQAAAARMIGALCGDDRRVSALARGTRIAERRTAVPPEELGSLTTIEQRNQVYRCAAPGIAFEAAQAALAGTDRSEVGCLVTSSCTGYMSPGWGVELVERLGLSHGTMRLPITEAGCAGGVVALGRASDYLRSRPGRSALAVSAELCSLSFHAGGDEGNLTASLIFGDGAGAALLTTGEAAGLELIDSSTTLIPGTQHVLGFDLTDHGFYPVLSRELVEVLPPAAGRAATALLRNAGLAPHDVSAWLLHPGGARLLSEIEQQLGLSRSQTQWSWDSMREFGNTSSAAIFDVVRRFMEEHSQRPGWAVIAGFGPGVSIELILARRQC